MRAHYAPYAPAKDHERDGPPGESDGHWADDRSRDAVATADTAREHAAVTEPQTMPDDQLLVERVSRGKPPSPMTWVVSVVFGLIWAIDAWFKWQPEFQDNFIKIVKGGAASQPSWLGPFYQFWETTIPPYAHALALATAVGETVIAVALILGFLRKYLYIIGALWSFGIWAIPEGFGNTSRAAYTDIGTSVIYVLVFAALWAIDACAGPRRYSLDALIERRLPWWRHIAEVKD